MIMAMACTMLLFTSCMEISLNGGLGKKIKASKTMVTRAMTPDAFDKLNVSAVANVKFVQSAEEECRVVMTAPDNYVELFKIESKNGLLDIDYTKPNINIENKKVSITVYAPQLSKISNTGVAQIETDSLVAPNPQVPFHVGDILWVVGEEEDLLALEQANAESAADPHLAPLKPHQ